MPRCTCAIDTEAGDQGSCNEKQVPSSGNRLPGKLSDSDSDLDSDERRCAKTCLLVPERLNGPAGAGGEAHYNGIATEQLRYGYAGDASIAVPSRADSGPPVSPLPIGTGGGAYRTYGWIRP